MKPPISIIVPTWNNPQYLDPCLISIKATGVLGGLCRLIVVNNGKQPVKDLVSGWQNTEVLEPGTNLGWERGLEFGLKATDSPFVVFQNDDTHIPKANYRFYYDLLAMFNSNNVAAAGPATTVAAGWHSIYQKMPLYAPSEVSFLIFFTVMLRRSDYDAVGGLDTSCPGGDDIDLSIRLRKAGKKLVINPDAFLIHHGFKTGERVRGSSNVAGGWNSPEMTERTNQFLIRKHGFKTFMETMRGLSLVYTQPIDSEGNVIRSIAKGGRILELGCGAQKTIEGSIGIDRVPKGEMIPHVAKISDADIVADVSKHLPIESLSYDIVIARHILEHCLDTVSTLVEWNRVIKIGGQMIIAVPNENVTAGIPLNPEHVHGFNPDSLKSMMEMCGFKQIEVIDPKNGISFVGCYEKVLHMSTITNGKELETANV